MSSRPSLEDEAFEGLATSLRALGNPKRLRLLRFLTRPRRLDEITSELAMTRQSAQEHVQNLVDVGIVQRVRRDRAPGGPAEYAIVPQRLFSIHDDLGKAGGLAAEAEPEEGLRLRTAALPPEEPVPREEDLPRLAIVHGMRIGLTVVLDGAGPWLVGREPDGTVNLDYDPFVSARHAEVRRAPGGFEVTDLYSSNGTFVDWKPVARGGSRRLDNGAVVRVGKTLLLFRRS